MLNNFQFINASSLLFALILYTTHRAASSSTYVDDIDGSMNMGADFDHTYETWHDNALLYPRSADPPDHHVIFTGTKEPVIYVPPDPPRWKANHFMLYIPKHDRFYSGSYVDYGSHLLFLNPSYHNIASYEKRQEARRRNIAMGRYSGQEKAFLDSQKNDHTLMEAMEHLSHNSATTGIISVPAHGQVFVHDRMSCVEARRRIKEGKVGVLTQNAQSGLVEFIPPAGAR